MKKDKMKKIMLKEILVRISNETEEQKDDIKYKYLYDHQSCKERTSNDTDYRVKVTEPTTIKKAA